MGINNAGEHITKIERVDIRPDIIGVGETKVVLQRHGKYVRDPENPKVGSLTPESEQTEREAARTFFETFLSQLPDEDRSTVDFIFIASDTSYLGGGKRSLETAVAVQDTAREVLSAQGIPLENIHHVGESSPKIMNKLREPNMLNDSSGYFEFLKGKYGNDGQLGKEFWEAFEHDTEKVTRLEMGAEGPDEITDRMQHTLNVLTRYSRQYHNQHPGRRLIIWADTHYDTISPLVKREILKTEKSSEVPVDYGAGISINVDTSGQCTTKINNITYPISLAKQSV